MTDKRIMIIPRERLFGAAGEYYFQDFRPHTETSDFESRILEHATFMPRNLVEDDPNLKQPIAYCTIINPRTKKVFAYQRAKTDKDYAERRLQGKYSWGIGGHIEEQDIENPIIESMLRELREEIGIRDISPTIVGYINDDEDSVGKVHFGLLYLVKTSLKRIRPISPEILQGKFRKLKELEELCERMDIEVEGWSEIIVGPLTNFL